MTGFTPTDEQVEAVRLAMTGGSLAIHAAAGSGKALRDDQPVLTPDGYVPIATLRVGDSVIGRDGASTLVTGVHPQGVVPLVDITVTTGVHIIASYDHLWECQTKQERDKRRGWSIRTTREIMDALDLDTTRSVWLPTTGAVRGTSQELPLDPWLLGVLIGDGGVTGRSVVLTNPEEQLLEWVDEVLPDGVMRVPSGGQYGWRLTGGGATRDGHRGFWNALVPLLEDVGIRGCGSHEKVIDPRYMAAPLADRLALFQGLMDTDGHADRHNLEWGTTSPKLAEQVRYLIESFGGMATVKVKQPTFRHQGEKRVGRDYWRFAIRFPAALSPFRLDRKRNAYTPKTKYPPARRIVEITTTQPGPATCITVDADDGLFLTTGCVPTHNSSTLRLIADAKVGDRGTLVAFNRSVVVEARTKFPGYVRCVTSHGAAFRTHGQPFSHRLNGPRMKSMDIARHLGVEALMYAGPTGTKRASAGFLAGYVLRGIRRFCQSADPEPSWRHIPTPDAMRTDPTLRQSWAAVREALAPQLAAAWVDINDPDGRLTYDHDFYRKRWALDDPRLDSDFILLDEAQDSADVVLGVLDAQRDHAQVILVGDENQQLYEFAGATDAMTKVESEHHAVLSTSFRFGPEIAAEANGVLVRIGTDMRVRGGGAPGRVGPIDFPDVVLSRTNAAAVAELFAELERGGSPHIVGGATDVIGFCRGAKRLMESGWTDHPELVCFDSWAEVRDYCTNDVLGGDLRMLVNLVEEYGVDDIIAALEHMPPPATASLILSTGHKAKGLEWESVRLASDFPDGESDKEPELPELRLLYVAVSRARTELDVSNVGLLRPQSSGPLALPLGSV